MIEVPVQYEDSIKEIIKILDAYAYDPVTAWKVVRLAAIMDLENSSPLGKSIALETLWKKYITIHE